MKPTSFKNDLNQEEWKNWIKETLYYCVLPTVIAFLTALQTGAGSVFALGAAETAFIASALNLLTKYRQGA